MIGCCLSAEVVLESSLWLIKFVQFASQLQAPTFHNGPDRLDLLRRSYQRACAPHSLLLLLFPLFRTRAICGECGAHSMLLGVSSCLFVIWLDEHEARMRYALCLPGGQHLYRLVV
jgi:hypothetical protein